MEHEMDKGCHENSIAAMVEEREGYIKAGVDANQMRETPSLREDRSLAPTGPWSVEAPGKIGQGSK